MADAELGRALVDYPGYGVEMCPHSHGDRLVAKSGPERGEKLPAEIDRMFAVMEGLCSEAELSIDKPGEHVKERMRALYPGLPGEAIGALRFAYTFWHK